MRSSTRVRQPNATVETEDGTHAWVSVHADLPFARARIDVRMTSLCKGQKTYELQSEAEAMPWRGRRGWRGRKPAYMYCISKKAHPQDDARGHARAHDVSHIDSELCSEVTVDFAPS